MLQPKLHDHKSFTSPDYKYYILVLLHIKYGVYIVLNMENLTVRDLFTIFVDIARELRQNDAAIDGQAEWQKYKKILDSGKWCAGKWRTLPKKESHLAMSLPEYTVDGYGKHDINELNHFLIQCYRIPAKEKPCLRKIMQVAFNVGQHLGMKKSRTSMLPPHDCDNYLLRQDANVKLADIIKESALIKLSSLLSYD